MTKLGIIGAMEIEVAILKSKLENAVVTKIGPMEFFEGTLAGCQVVIVMCGVGKVHAAMCTQVLCSNFGVTHIVNTGVAGSLDAQLDICDVLVSTDAVQHDMDVHYLGYEVGRVPGLNTTAFAADEQLKKLAFDNWDDMYAAIGYGGLTATKAVGRIRDDINRAIKAQEAEKQPKLLRTIPDSEAMRRNRHAVNGVIEGQRLELCACRLHNGRLVLSREGLKRRHVQLIEAADIGKEVLHFFRIVQRHRCDLHGDQRRVIPVLRHCGEFIHQQPVLVGDVAVLKFSFHALLLTFSIILLNKQRKHNLGHPCIFLLQG